MKFRPEQIVFVNIPGKQNVVCVTMISFSAFTGVQASFPAASTGISRGLCSTNSRQNFPLVTRECSIHRVVTTCRVWTSLSIKLPLAVTAIISKAIGLSLVLCTQQLHSDICMLNVKGPRKEEQIVCYKIVKNRLFSMEAIASFILIYW